MWLSCQGYSYWCIGQVVDDHHVPCRVDKGFVAQVADCASGREAPLDPRQAVRPSHPQFPSAPDRDRMHGS